MLLLPIIGYSTLNKENLLSNETRLKIYSIIQHRKNGIKASEIINRLNIKHHSQAQYHLKRLNEYRMIKKLDSKYYPYDAQIEPSIIAMITNAISHGAKGPSEISVKIGSYPSKVQYYLKKYQLFQENEK